MVGQRSEQPQGRRRYRVFIVDDEPGARDTLEALLYPEEYDLAYAASGDEALTKLEGLDPDTILLDVMMPGLNGFQVCRRLKTSEQWQHVPVVLITALDSREDLARGLDAGADEFLTKPVNGVELRARVRSMLRIKSQYDRLQEALRLREDLTNMIIHDMRSPLTAILGSCDFLQENVTTSDGLGLIETIRLSSLRLTSFLNDMLMLTKMQEGKLLLNRSIVDMNQMVLTAKMSCSSIARSRGIELAIDLPKNSQQVYLDAHLFQRVLENLISNAVKFSPFGSTVTLRAEYPSTMPSKFRTCIQVLDCGPGIPEKDRERIFEKFEIVDLHKRTVPQVGLGLAFCKMVVQAHGGRIYVQANEPRGSIFTVEV